MTSNTNHSRHHWYSVVHCNCNLLRWCQTYQTGRLLTLELHSQWLTIYSTLVTISDFFLLLPSTVASYNFPPSTCLRISAYWGPPSVIEKHPSQNQIRSPHPPAQYQWLNHFMQVEIALLGFPFILRAESKFSPWMWRPHGTPGSNRTEVESKTIAFKR